MVDGEKGISLKDLMEAKKRNADQADIYLAKKHDSSLPLVLNPSEFTEKELAQIEELKGKIDLTDSHLTSMYGASVQKRLSDFSSVVLENIKSEGGNVNLDRTLNDLATRVMDFNNTNTLGILDKIPFLNKEKLARDKYLASYEVMEMQIDKISSTLQSYKQDLIQNITMLEKMYEENLEHFSKLKVYLKAGRDFSKETRDRVLPNLYQEAESSNDPMNLELVRDYEERLSSFERRLEGLELSKVIALQTGPQIRLIQNNDKLVLERIDESINSIIPLWKSQVVVALGLKRQEEIALKGRKVSDLAGKMILQESQNIKDQMKKIGGGESLDIDKLKAANQYLVEAVKEAQSLSKQARETRMTAEGELVKIENDLTKALKDEGIRAKTNIISLTD